MNAKHPKETPLSSSVPSKWICPRCKGTFDKAKDIPVISRADNKTEICSACGTEEALLEWMCFA